MNRVARLGCRRSTGDRLVGKMPLHEHPAVKARLAAGSLPSSVDLEQFSPKGLDQGQAGACTAFAISGALVTAFAAAGKPLSFIPSQREIYAATRAIERAVANPAPDALPPLGDTGAMVADVMTAIGSFGIKPMAVPQSPDGRISDIWTDADTGPGTGNVNLEPDVGDLEAAAAMTESGAYVLDPSASNASDVIAAALAVGIPVDMAFDVDSAFENLQPGQVAGAPVQSDILGGHSLYLNGYELMSDGTRVLWARNSWGSWCDNGRCLVGPAWLKAAMEAWPVAVVKGGA